MNPSRILAIGFFVVALALMITAVVWSIQGNEQAIWAYAFGVFWLTRCDHCWFTYCFERIEKKERENANGD